VSVDVIRERLDAQDWGELHSRLVDFADHRCGKRAEAQARDLAQAAITRVYSYESKWDPAKEPDLLRFLMSVVNSLLANERTSAAARTTRSVSSPKTGREASKVADARPLPDEQLAGADLLSRRMTLLHERCAGDADVLRMLELLAAGLESPAEMREATGWTTDAVVATRRRMLRAAASVARALGGDFEEGRLHAGSDEEEEGGQG
jgi:DNA-directed RNA polymerase specialized sigma24 family protein